MDFIPTAILGDTIGPLMMSGKNKIRGAQVAKVGEGEPMASEDNSRSLPHLMRWRFFVSGRLAVARFGRHRSTA